MAKRQIRPIRIDGNIAYITLTRGYVAIVDCDDLALVAPWNWRSDVRSHTVYARRVTPRCGGQQHDVQLHRTILQAPAGHCVDHIDGNGLNNRRSNLRFASESQNNFNKRISRKNSSGFKGVSWDKRKRKWKSQICFNGRCKRLGNYQTAELAHAAYIEAAKKLFGEFARAA